MFIYVLIFLGVILFDQIGKILITRAFTTGEGKTIIDGVLSFVYVENKGAAFGILSGARVFFIIATVLIFALGIWYFKKNPMQNNLERLSIAFISGGAIGNFIDRIFLGYVRDFISADFIDFPVFNIADCFVCIGTALYVICILFEGKLNGNKS